MDWPDLPLHVIGLLLAAITNAILVGFGWRRRARAGALPFAALMLGITVWSLAYALELDSALLPMKVFWAKVQYLGIATAPASWLIFVLYHTGRQRMVRRRNLWLLFVVPYFVLLMTWTNEWHGLIWRNMHLATSGPYVLLKMEYGPGFWLHVGYSYLVLGLGTFLLLSKSLRSPDLYRGQTIALLIAACGPWVGNILYILDLTPVPGLDLTPFAFTVSGLAIGFGLLRFRLLDIMPIARDALVEGMSDGMIVLDDDDRVVDLNPAARRIIGSPVTAIVGQTANQVLAAWSDPVKGQEWLTAGSQEITYGAGESLRHYQSRVSDLRGPLGRSGGRLIVLYDVTERKRMEQALRESEKRFRTLFELAPEAFILIEMKDAEGDPRIIDCNEAAARMTGYERSELVGASLTILCAAGCPIEDEADLMRQLRPGEPLQYETRRSRKDGSIFPADVTADRVNLEGRELILATTRDITERKRAEEIVWRAHEELEQRVEQRTLDLRSANEQLRREIAEREAVEGALRHRAGIERLVTAISTRFINLASDQIGNEITSTPG